MVFGICGHDWTNEEDGSEEKCDDLHDGGIIENVRTIFNEDISKLL